MTAARDDLGREVDVPRTVRRVVSLVPSLTESVAETAADVLVGATDWCTHPSGLEVVRVGGTKSPDLAAVLALGPDVVLANAEENRAVDLDALRSAGLAVWVTAPETVAAALRSLDRMLRLACRLERPRWLDAADAMWAEAFAGTRRRALVPIWRRPWMALGRDTFAGDVLARLGVDNVLADDQERYPKVDLDAVRRLDPDLVVLPDEPYAFTPDEGRELFGGWGVPVVHVDGRDLTWYGPSLAQARSRLAAALAGGRPE